MARPLLLTYHSDGEATFTDLPQWWGGHFQGPTAVMARPLLGTYRSDGEVVLSVGLEELTPVCSVNLHPGTSRHSLPTLQILLLQKATTKLGAEFRVITAKIRISADWKQLSSWVMFTKFVTCSRFRISWRPNVGPVTAVFLRENNFWIKWNTLIKVVIAVNLPGSCKAVVLPVVFKVEGKTAAITGGCWFKEQTEK